MRDDASSRCHPKSTFELAAGIRLEPFADGTAILFSPEQEVTVSLNPTAALLCAHADGQHTLSAVWNQVRRLYPSEKVTIEPFLACCRELEERGFLLLRSP